MNTLRRSFLLLMAASAVGFAPHAAMAANGAAAKGAKARPPAKAASAGSTKSSGGSETAKGTASGASASPTVDRPLVDKADYDRRLRRLAHLSSSTVSGLSVKTSSGTIKHAAKHTLWPAKAPYPEAGAILPFKRVVAFYGNFHSKRMGILGEYPEDEVLRRLKTVVTDWNAADPQTPVLPAIHYVAVTAQGYAGADGLYRLRMPDSDLQRVLAMAEKAEGIAILDVQVGKSRVSAEVPTLDAYLKLPQVHLALDPEFSMKGAAAPGHKIGTMDATDINWAINHLSKIVAENHLPPKILIVHRFVPQMVTNVRQIRPTPQVEVVIDVDGWGAPEDKIATYHLCATRQPVQFTGFKIFYKNDLRPAGSRHLTPAEVLKLTPQPIYIQYQ